MRYFFLNLAYKIIDILSINGRAPYMIKLKLLLGIALLSSNIIKAQNTDLQNNKTKADTLKIDTVLINEPELILCYAVMVIEEPKIKEKPREIRNQNGIKSFFRGNMREPEKYINSIISD